MNRITIFALGIIPGIFWGTLYGLYDKSWIPSLMYMIGIILFILIIEFALSKETAEVKKHE